MVDLAPLMFLAWDKDYTTLEQHNPAAEHHFLVIPRTHDGAAQNSSPVRFPAVMAVKEIGTRILDDLGVPPEKRRYARFPEATH